VWDQKKTLKASYIHQSSGRQIDTQHSFVFHKGNQRYIYIYIHVCTHEVQIDQILLIGISESFHMDHPKDQPRIVWSTGLPEHIFFFENNLDVFSPGNFLLGG